VAVLILVLSVEVRSSPGVRPMELSNPTRDVFMGRSDCRSSTST
jgi:hypothetical protein